MHWFLSCRWSPLSPDHPGLGSEVVSFRAALWDCPSPLFPRCGHDSCPFSASSAVWRRLLWGLPCLPSGFPAEVSPGGRGGALITPLYPRTNGPPRVYKEIPVCRGPPRPPPASRLTAPRRVGVYVPGRGGGATAATLHFRGGAGGRTGEAGRGAQWPGLSGAPRRQERQGAGTGPGSGTMSGEWRLGRCHPAGPAPAALAAHFGPYSPGPAPRAPSQRPQLPDPV